MLTLAQLSPLLAVHPHPAPALTQTYAVEAVPPSMAPVGDTVY